MQSTVPEKARNSQLDQCTGSEEAMASKRKVLIVEDNEAISFLLQRMVEMEGHAAQTAANGREALTLLQHYMPDLIIADLAMPVMDGRTFLSEVRRRLETRHVPVLVVSSSPDLSRRVADLSVDGCLAKPFDHGDLIAHLERLLSARVAVEAAARQP